MSIHPMASPTACLVSIEVNYLTVTSDCSCLVKSIIITYYHHFRGRILTFISITNLLYFLIQVYFFEEGKNMGIITRC